MTITIATTPDFPDFVQTTVLGDTIFRLQFIFNSRQQSWYLSIFEAGGGVLVHGIRLRTTWDVIRQLVQVEMPDGAIIPTDVEGRGAEPGRNDLVEGKIPVVFVPEDEIDELLAG